METNVQEELCQGECLTFLKVSPEFTKDSEWGPG